MLVRHRFLTKRSLVHKANRRAYFDVQRLCLAAFLLFALALLALPAWAQVEGATVRGVISSPDGPASGITVRAVNVANGQSRTTRTGNDGSYVMVNLRPGTYRIQVATTGEGEEVTLRVGQSAVLNFQIGAAAAETEQDAQRPQIAEPGMPAPMEEIVVTGVQIETFTGGEVGTSITPEMMDRLPQVNRNFLAFADL